MKPLNFFKDIISNQNSIIDFHEEIEGENFSLTGTLIHDKHQRVFNFQFCTRGKVMDWPMYSLTIIDKTIVRS
jgi:hypothetical protein